MSLKQIFIFMLIFCILPSRMLYSILNETVNGEKIHAVLEMDLETEEEDKKEDTKKEKEEYKFMHKYSFDLDLKEVLGKLYNSSIHIYSNPAKSTTTPPPDFI